MEKKLGQEPTFPIEINNDKFHISGIGISKRFYAACAAMQGILSNEDLRIAILKDEINGHGNFAKIAFEFADELLKQEYE